MQKGSLPPRAFSHLMRNLNGSVKCRLNHAALRANQNSLSVMSLKTSHLTSATYLFLIPTDLSFQSSFRRRLHPETAASQATQVNRPPSSQTLAPLQGKTRRFINIITLTRHNNILGNLKQKHKNTEISTCATHRSDGNTPQTPLSHTDILSRRTLLQLNFKKEPSLTA